MAGMTSRERLTAFFKGQEIDRIPWSPLVDYYFLSSLKNQVKEMDLVEASEYIGFDLMERHVPTYSDPVGASVKLIFKGNVEHEVERKDNLIINRFVTPVGQIEEIRKTTEVIKYGFITKHYIETIEDAKIYHYIVENMDFEPMLREFKERDEYIGQRGLAVPSAPITPIQQVLQFLIGVEKTVFMLMDHPEEMKALFELMHEKNKECLKVLVEYPSEIFFAYEDTSTTVISPDMYRKWCKPYIDEYADIIHSAGKKYITHMCGKLKEIVSEIGEGKMDGFDSLCPPTTGNLTADEARREFGDEKIIIGGIEPPALVRMSVEETREYVIEILRKMAPGKNFILSTGDATPHGTPVENLIEITRVVEEYGGYPLKF